MAIIPLSDNAVLDGPGTVLSPLPADAQLDPPASTPQPHTLLQKIGHGLGDTALGALETIGHMPPEPMLAPPTGSMSPLEIAQQGGAPISKYISQREAPWQAERAATGDKGFEWARLGGQALGAAPLMALMPEAGEGLIPGVLNGVGKGIAASLMQPVGDVPGGYGAAKAKQIALGGVTGGGFGGVLGWLRRGQPASMPSVADYRGSVNLLRGEGVPPTLGQNIGPNAAKFEDAVSNVNPAIGSAQNSTLKKFNVAVYNRALQPLSEATGSDIQYTGPASRKGIKAVGDMLSDGFESVKNRVSLPITDGVLSDLGKVADEAGASTQALSDRVQKFISKNILDRADNTGTLSGQAFKDVENALTTEAKGYAGSPLGDEKKYAHALFDAADVMRNHLAAANPQEANTLHALNKGWAVLTRIENAAPTSNPDGLFTPAQLARSVETADSTVRHRAYVRGEALLSDLSDAGLRVLGNKYPNSGSFGRYAAGSAVLGGAAHFSPIGAGILAGTSLAYLPPVQRGLGAVVSGASQIPSLMAPAMGSLQQAAPYLTPAFLGATSRRPTSLMDTKQ